MSRPAPRRLRRREPPRGRADDGSAARTASPPATGRPGRAPPRRPPCRRRGRCRRRAVRRTRGWTVSPPTARARRCRGPPPTARPTSAAGHAGRRGARPERRSRRAGRCSRPGPRPSTRPSPARRSSTWHRAPWRVSASPPRRAATDARYCPSSRRRARRGTAGGHTPGRRRASAGGWPSPGARGSASARSPGPPGSPVGRRVRRGRGRRRGNRGW